MGAKAGMSAAECWARQGPLQEEKGREAGMCRRDPGWVVRPSVQPSPRDRSAPNPASQYHCHPGSHISAAVRSGKEQVQAMAVPVHDSALQVPVRAQAALTHNGSTEASLTL